MNWLLALLAFAGIMAVLSTVVTAAVEGIHKIFSLRRSGLQEMLRSMHDSVFVDVGDSRPASRETLLAKGNSKQAAQFANDMTKSPAYGGGGRWWWPSNWGMNISQRRFERLTPRQFAEQLSQTQIGQELATRPRADIRQAIARSTYEFDRYGVAQSEYFGRRAKVLSAFVAFIFVVFANFNAIDVYMHLANNDASRNQLLAAFSEGDAIDVQSLQAVIRKATTVDDDGQMPSEAEVQQAAANLVTLRNSLQVGEFGGAGLPVGAKRFPFCAGGSLDGGACNTNVGPIQLLNYKVDAPAPIEQLFANPSRSAVWLMSMIASASLLALGSPFWYNLFARLAQVAGGAAKNAALEAQEVRKAEVTSRAGRGAEDPGIEELTDAFLISAGVGPAATPSRPRGARLGPASSSLVGGAATTVATSPARAPAQSGGGGTVERVRRVRRIQGDWTGRD